MSVHLSKIVNLARPLVASVFLSTLVLSTVKPVSAATANVTVFRVDNGPTNQLPSEIVTYTANADWQTPGLQADSYIGFAYSTTPYDVRSFWSQTFYKPDTISGTVTVRSPYRNGKFQMFIGVIDPSSEDGVYKASAIAYYDAPTGTSY